MKTSNQANQAEEKEVEVKEAKARPLTSEETIIAKWKAEHGKVFRSHIDGEPYIWRKLKRKEYVELMAIRAEEGQAQGGLYERQEAITLMCILSPSQEDMTKLIAENGGLASSLSDEILSKSGFDIEETVEL